MEMYKCYKSRPENQLLNIYQHITPHRVTEENLKSYMSKADSCDFFFLTTQNPHTSALGTTYSY